MIGLESLISSISSKAGECSEGSTRLALCTEEEEEEEDEPEEEADAGEKSIGDMDGGVEDERDKRRRREV
jgi:hypothetical protein